jgi:peptidoglycan hydrolase-like protein with peptidoglycan-binding domain
MKLLASTLLLFGFLLAAPVFPKDAPSSEHVRKSQEALKDKGYYHGEADGKLGPQTRAALRAYQKDHNLAANGRFTRETAEKLGVVEGDPSVGDHFEDAGDALKQGGRAMKEEVKEGEITEGAKEIGKGVGKAAKRTAKGVKDVFDGDDKKKPADRKP